MSILIDSLVVELKRRVELLEAKVTQLERERDEAQVALERSQERRSRHINGR